MDMYGLSTTAAQDLFRIDDLLDFSNDEIFSSSSSAGTTANNNTAAVTNDINQLPPPQNPSIDSFNNHSSLSTDFTDDLCVPVCSYLLILLKPFLKKLFSLFF